MGARGTKDGEQINYIAHYFSFLMVELFAYNEKTIR